MTTPTPLYVLHSGMVKSATDGQVHYVGAAPLANLYGVSMRDCVIYVSEDRLPRGSRPLVHLYPRDDGNYTLPEVA